MTVEHAEIIYEAQWADYEEDGCVEIIEDNTGQLYAIYGGTNVFQDVPYPYWDELEEITMEEAISIIDEWDEIEKWDDNWWSKNGWG